jgi:Prolyl oligopeptidase family.
MKKIIRILIVLIIIITISLAAGSIYFYNIAIKRTDKSAIFQDLSTENDASIMEDAKSQEWLEAQKIKEIEIFTVNGLKLKGYYLEADKSSDKTVILVHGYSGQAKEMAVYAKYYYEQLGYNIFMPDARGHGESDGNYIGFGWPERKDILQWIDYLIRLTGKETQIVLHGVSMGGATVLMTSGEEVPPNVKAVISDCAYTSADVQFAYQLKELYNLPKFPLVYTTSLVAKIRAGYFLGEASALEQVKKSELPTLFIHGDNDNFVPSKMVYELYDACNAPKELLIVENAGHTEAYKANAAAYEAKISQFLSQYVE